MGSTVIRIDERVRCPRQEFLDARGTSPRQERLAREKSDLARILAAYEIPMALVIALPEVNVQPEWEQV